MFLHRRWCPSVFGVFLFAKPTYCSRLLCLMDIVTIAGFCRR